MESCKTFHRLPFQRPQYTVKRSSKVPIGWMSCDIHMIYHIQTSYQKFSTTLTHNGAAWRLCPLHLLNIYCYITMMCNKSYSNRHETKKRETPELSNCWSINYSVYPNTRVLQYMLPLLIAIQFSSLYTSAFNFPSPAVCIGAAATSSAVFFYVEMTQTAFILNRTMM